MQGSEYVCTVQVFRPFECDLRPWDARKFAQCTAKKRIVMIGDSLMRQQFQSLACLTSNVTVSQHPTPQTGSAHLHQSQGAGDGNAAVQTRTGTDNVRTLLRQVKGEHHNWDEEQIPVARSRNYTARGIAGDFVIPRQYIGGFDLDSGSKVFLRYCATRSFPFGCTTLACVHTR